MFFVTDVRAIVSFWVCFDFFFLRMTRKKNYFQYCFCKFAVSDLEQKKKENEEVKKEKNGIAVRP